MTSTPAAAAAPLVVVTGAAGRVGRLSVAALTPHYRLRLVDLRWPDDGGGPVPGASAEQVTADLRDPDAWPAVLSGADLVVHLAGDPSPEIDARTAVEDVAMSTAHLAAAAPGSGLRRIVYASSIHSAGLYDRDSRRPVDPGWPARPCCEYGAAKVLGENLLRLLTERTPVSVACLRLGMTGKLPQTTHQVSHWLADDDFHRLLRAALTSDVRFGSYFGVSVAATRCWDVTSNEAELGWRPSVPPPRIASADVPPAVGRCLMGA